MRRRRRLRGWRCEEQQRGDSYRASALERLALLEREREHIMETAERLAFMAGMLRMNDAPAATFTRQANGVQIEAQDLAAKAIGLRHAINTAHGDTLDALKEKGL